MILDNKKKNVVPAAKKKKKICISREIICVMVGVVIRLRKMGIDKYLSSRNSSWRDNVLIGVAYC